MDKDQRLLLRGCTDFYKGTAIIKGRLPTSRPYCQYCVPWCKHNFGLERAECLLTGELLLDYKKSIGNECPFKWEGGNNFE